VKKKKFLWSFFIGGLFCFSVLSFCAEEEKSYLGPNLLNNPDFEESVYLENVPGWKIIKFPERYSFRLDQNVKHSGKQSLCVESVGLEEATIDTRMHWTSDRMSIAGGKTYRVTGWHKTSLTTSPKGRATIELIWFDEKNRRIGGTSVYERSIFSLDAGFIPVWGMFEIIAKSPPQATGLLIKYVVANDRKLIEKTSYWLDNLAVQIFTPPPAEKKVYNEKSPFDFGNIHSTGNDPENNNQPFATVSNEISKVPMLVMFIQSLRLEPGHYQVSIPLRLLKKVPPDTLVARLECCAHDSLLNGAAQNMTFIYGRDFPDCSKYHTFTADYIQPPGCRMHFRMLWLPIASLRMGTFRIYQRHLFHGDKEILTYYPGPLRAWYLEREKMRKK